MSSIGTGYDLSASQFSPDGRVFQVEYAKKAVENGGTVIGLRGKDGVVFAVEKIVTSKLYEPSTNKRIFNVDQHVGMAVSGLISDARRIVEVARSEAASYKSEYGVGIPLKYLNERVSMYMHAYTLYSAVRPYGCSVILSAYEHDGPAMYMIDPSAVSFGYYGCAVGKAKQSAKTEIEKLKLSDMTCNDLVKEAARIIYLVHDELKDKQFKLEMSWVGKHTNGKHESVPADIKADAEAKAKQAMAEDSDSDTEDMYAWFMSTLGFASIGNLTVMAVERWLLVAKPMNALSIRHAVILGFFVWVYALCLSVPPLFGWGSYGPEAGNVSCSVSWEIHDPVTKSDSYIGFIFTFGLVIPVLVITTSYVAIVLTLRKVRKRAGASGRREAKITKMVALMITAFLLAWSPYAALALAAQYFDAKPSASVAVLPALLAKSSICYNPIIYAGLNSQFPRSLKKIFDVRPARSSVPGSQNTALTTLNKQEQKN